MENPDQTWACVHTHPQAERWAESNLRAKGYTTWLPTVGIKRRDRVLRTMWHPVEVPAFARYVLVRHRKGEPFSPIRYTEGVARLLTMDGHPLHASSEAVESLRAVLGAASTQEAGDAPYRPGQALRWRSGALRGIDAIAIHSDRRITTVSAIMLGQLRTVTAPTRDFALRD